MRLLLASSVLLYHCWPLGGFSHPSWLPRTLGAVGVDSFFILSGFLITRSWRHSKSTWRYAWHRFLRIIPAYWVCLAATAFVAAPVVWSGQRLAGGYWSAEPLNYVSSNFFLLQRQLDIAGTPVDVPFPGSWNGSLYTLFYEALCYGGIAALGIVGALRSRNTLPALFLAAWAGYVAALSSAWTTGR